MVLDSASPLRTASKGSWDEMTWNASPSRYAGRSQSRGSLCPQFPRRISGGIQTYQSPPLLHGKKNQSADTNGC